MSHRLLFVAFALAAAPAAFAGNSSDTWLPAAEGNEWIFSNGHETYRIGVDYESEDTYWLSGLLGTDFWIWEDPADPTLYSRVYAWNADNSRWYNLFKFEKPIGASWSFDLTSGACDTFSAHKQDSRLTIETPAGDFYNARQYDFTLVPEANVRCAKPLMADVQLAPYVGPVAFHGTDGSDWSLVYANVDGWTYEPPLRAVDRANNLRATLQVDSYIYESSPNTIACITTPCPGNEVTAVAHVVLTVRNTGTTVRTYQFNSGQQVDFAIVDEQGQVVQQWSNGRMFTMALTAVTLAPGESKTWSADLEMKDVSGMQLDGRYSIEGWMLGTYSQPAVAVESHIVQ